MATVEQDEEQKEQEEELLHQMKAELAHVQTRIGARFRRAEVRKRGGRFLEGLMSEVPRKNGWQMAEALGEEGPRGVQRLLGEADWDEEGVRDDLRAYVIEALGEADGILVMDETGFVKKGKRSAGVARQYSGTAGRRENSQVGVFLLYASHKGYAFIDRALYLPEEWIADRVRCREAGIPDEVGFATKGALAQQMLLRAFEASVPVNWVVGDTVYGYDELRMFLEGRQKNYVLAVPETHTVWVQGEPQTVGLLAALLPQEAWVVLSAGEGSKGERLYEWAWLRLPEKEPVSQGKLHWVLIRRNLSDPSERAYYRAYAPADTTLAELMRVTGSRWRIEEGYEQAKGEVGLDQYEVRGFRAWSRHVTLALLAHAVLAKLRTQANEKEKKVEQSRNISCGVSQNCAGSSRSCGNRKNSARTGSIGHVSEGSIKRQPGAAIGSVVPVRHP